jgi:hypothetical protein
VGSTVSTGNVQHTINGSLEGAAWFFGILDGADLDTLTIPISKWTTSGCDI